MEAFGSILWTAVDCQCSKWVTIYINYTMIRLAHVRALSVTRRFCYFPGASSLFPGRSQRLVRRHDA